MPATVKAQATNVVVDPSVNWAVSNVFGFLGSGSNFLTAAYGIASSDGEKFGAGLALAYKVSEFVAPVLRLDWYDGRIWMPSGSVQLQFPIVLGASGVRLYPFVFTGIGTPLGDRGDEEEVVGIAGIGAALRLNERFSLVGDVEKWSSFDAYQIRFGALIRW